jgi:hypothetical protein
LKGLIFLKLLILRRYKRRNMNSKLWIHRALSMCLVVAMIATYSMVALAGSEKVAGELIVTGKTVNGETPVVTVNGETAKTGRSVFSSSTIATPDNASAIINMGRAGKIELAPNTTLTVTFSEKGISGDLLSGKVTVLGASTNVGIKTADGNTVELTAGESATTAGKTAQDKDDDDDKGGAAWWPWALVFGGAAAGIIWAATSSDNNISLGGSGTVVSPNR